MFRYCFAVLSILIFVPYSFGQDSLLWIDGVNVKLNMPKQEVVKLFSANHNLKQLGDSDSWLILRKDSESSIVGQVSFKNGKLRWGSQNWGRFTSEDASALGNNIFAVLNGIHESGEDIVTVKTYTRRSPEITLNSIELIYKTKKVIISTVEGKSSVKSVVIQEDLIE